MDLSALKPLLFLLSFTSFAAAQVVLPPGPLEALVGKNVTFKTLLDQPAYMIIIWNVNINRVQINIGSVGEKGLKVKDPYTGRAFINATTGFLTLTGLKTSDSGEYNINIVSAEGDTKTGEIELLVLEPVSDVLIKSNVPEAIELNTNVVLTCTGKGSIQKFSWLNGTATIVSDSSKRITVSENATSGTLSITGVLRTDLVDPIFCSASNSLASAKSAAFNLTVHYGPEEVTISPLKPPEFVAAGSNFSLSCAARSKPQPVFSWFQNTTNLEFSEAVLPLKVIEQKGLGSNASLYFCKATNVKTTKVVQSAGVTFTIIEAISGVKMSTLTGVFFAGNSSANLSCTVTKGTVKTVTWLRNGKALTADTRVTFSRDGSSIFINPLQKEDNGEFTCQMSNQVNSAMANVTLTVNYGPESVTVNGETQVEVNDPMRLVCSAPSVPPARYIWKFNGTKTPITTEDYIIDKVTYDNMGTYACEASNDLTGKTSTNTFFLTVKAVGELDKGLSDGAIAGIVIAALVATAVAIGLFFYCRQKIPVESPY